MNIRLNLFFALFSFGLSPLAQALVVTTASDEDLDPGTGLSLREALAQATSGDTITFHPSLADQVCILDQDLAQLEIEDLALTIDASALTAPFTIDFTRSSEFLLPTYLRILESTGATSQVSLKGLIFQNCTREAITLGNGAQLSVDQCQFLDNGNFTYSDGQVGSLSVLGGAIQVGEFCNLVVTRSTFLRNKGQNGGAIYAMFGSSLALSGSSFFHNESLTTGGAVTQRQSSSAMDRCTFANNRGSLGGAVYQGEGFGSTIQTFEQCTFSGNTGSSGGSAIWSDTNNLSLHHCTVYQNPVFNADSHAIELPSASGDFVEFSHNIIAHNLGPFAQPANYSGPTTVSEGYNLSDSDELGPAQVGDQWHIHPLLAPLTDNGGLVPTHLPYAASPAIDAGDSSFSSPPNNDPRSQPRVQDGDGDSSAVIDVGAAEAPPMIEVTSTEDLIDNTGDLTLREAIANAPANARITFHPNLNGETIRLAASAGGQGAPLVIDKNLILDATTLPRGLEISGVGETSLFTTTIDTFVSLHAFTLKNGLSSGSGGAIYHQGNLLLDMCTLRNNQAAFYGGAILSADGLLHLHNSTLTQNQSSFGGAVAAEPGRPFTLQSEFSTIFDNTASSSASGLYLNSSPSSFYFTILAENTGPSGDTDNIFFTAGNPVTSYGFNVENTTEVGFTHTKDSQGTSPALSPHANNGGFARTCALSAGPAYQISELDGIHPVPRPPFDNRGYTRVFQSSGTSNYHHATDAGAYQHNGDSDLLDSDGLPTYYEIWNGLNPYDSADALLDPDNDGINTLTEYNNGTDPFHAQFPTPIAFSDIIADLSANSLSLTWVSTPLTTYDLYTYDALDGWNYHSSHTTDSDDLSFTVTFSAWDFTGTPVTLFRGSTQP